MCSGRVSLVGGELTGNESRNEVAGTFVILYHNSVLDSLGGYTRSAYLLVWFYFYLI